MIVTMSTKNNHLILALAATTRILALDLTILTTAHTTGHLTLTHIDAIGLAAIITTTGLTGALAGRIWELTTTPHPTPRRSNPS